MKQDMKYEIEFSEQLNDFQAAMENDLNQRQINFCAKLEQDFDAWRPTQKPALQKSQSWEPVVVETIDENRNDEQPAFDNIENQQSLINQQRPVRQIIAKPRMNIGNLTSDKQRLSILSSSFNQQRPSIFTDSFNLRKSTEGDSIFGSMVESSGKISIVDHFSQSFEYRTSLVRNMHHHHHQQNQQHQKLRAIAANQQEERIHEQSEGGGSSSLNDRCSSMVEDGPSNDIVVKYLAITATKSRSVENPRQADDRVDDENALVPVCIEDDDAEEFKESVGVEGDVCSGKRKERKAAATRLMPIRSFIQPSEEIGDEDSQDPFNRVIGPKSTIGMQIQRGSLQQVDNINAQENVDDDDDDEECNAIDDTDEYSTQKKIPVGPATRSPNNQNKAASSGTIHTNFVARPPSFK